MRVAKIVKVGSEHWRKEMATILGAWVDDE